MESTDFLIVGSGVYSSYMCKLIRDKYPSASVSLVDLSQSSGLTSKEVSITDENISGIQYSALGKGRYFGWGGTAIRWGGQLFLFSKKDANRIGNSFIRELAQLSEKYQQSIEKVLGLNGLGSIEGSVHGYSTRVGLWLRPDRRSLNRFRLKRIRHVGRLKQIVYSGDRIDYLEVESDGHITSLKAKYYFIGVGAFEHMRVFAQSGLAPMSFSFGDHVSIRLIKSRAKLSIGGEEFAYQIENFGLKTRRFVGVQEGRSYYLHPVFNDERGLIKTLKKVIIDRDVKALLLIFRWSNLVMIFRLILKRKFDPSNIEDYYWNLDVENFCVNGGQIVDVKNEEFFRVIIDYKNESILEEITRKIIDKYSFIEGSLTENINVDKYEDIHHPYGMILYDSIDEMLSLFKNGLALSTANLPTAGSINPTASLFPLLHYYVDNYIDEAHIS